MKNRKLNLKCALIGAMTLLLLAGNSMKSYAQPPITWTAKNGIALTFDDIIESYDRYDENGNLTDPLVEFLPGGMYYLNVAGQTVKFVKR